MNRTRPRPVLVTVLVLVSVLFPAAAVLAQANETDAGDANATGDEATNGTEDAPGNLDPAGADNETGNETANGTDEQAAPVREGSMTDEDAEEAVGSAGTAWVLTISVIVVSLLVGFAVAAVAGDRRR